MLFIIAGVIEVASDINLILVPTYYFMFVIFFAVISIAPHIHIVALQSWYGVESEKKK